MLLRIKDNKIKVNSVKSLILKSKVNDLRHICNGYFHCGQQLIICTHMKNLYTHCKICGEVCKNKIILAVCLDGNIRNSMYMIKIIAKDIAIFSHGNFNRTIINLKTNERRSYNSEIYTSFYYKNIIILPLRKTVYYFDDKFVIGNYIYKFWSYAERELFDYKDFIAPWGNKIRPAKFYITLYIILRKKYKIPRPLFIVILEMI